jgi:hypothetical protein
MGNIRIYSPLFFFYLRSIIEAPSHFIPSESILEAVHHTSQLAVLVEV